MKKFSLFAICVMACLLVGCEPKITEQKPTVNTEDVTEVQETSALVTCNVTNDGGASVTERGVVYSLYSNPKASDLSTTKIKNGSGIGKYSCNLTELQSNYKYYVRAYAINKVGVEYGKEISFITLKKLLPPTVSTDNITDILATSAIVTGSIISDGGAYISESGIVYNTSENPTISNNKVLSSERSGTFQCNLTDLQEQTTYYVRAYAINEKGVAYGEEKSFTTQSLSLPTVSLASITDISYTSAIVTGEVSDDGKSIVYERGVVYSISQNPTISDYNVQCGSGLGEFTCNLLDLQEKTTYYVRTYAINAKGVSYSNENTFTTISGDPTILTHEATNISSGTALIKGEIKHEGLSAITERGFVYAMSQNPTISDSKVQCGSGLGEYTCNLKELQESTTYYVRAYAVNQKGIHYGNEISFVTSAAVGMENGHEWIDLGLPSGLKWATCNVGASSQDETGDYFAWGETQARYLNECKNASDVTKCMDERYKWFEINENGNAKPIKYNTYDKKLVLDIEDDAARANWGGNWRMPTPEEIDELVNICQWVKHIDNGYIATCYYEVIGPSGQSIYFYLPYHEGNNYYYSIQSNSISAYESINYLKCKRLSIGISCIYDNMIAHWSGQFYMINDRRSLLGVIRPVCP